MEENGGNQGESICFCCTMLCISKHVHNFSPSDSHTILVFAYQVFWQYSDRDPPNGGVECRLGTKKLLFLTCILLRHVLSVVQPSGVVNRMPQDLGMLVTLLADSTKQQRFLIAEGG